MADFDALIKQSEQDQQVVTKPAMPEIKGKRRPVMVYIGEGKPGVGHLVELPGTFKLIHEHRVQSLTVTHVAWLVHLGDGTYSIKTEFAHARQNPSTKVSFVGTLTKTENGFSGAVTVSSPSHESTQTWDVEYDD